MGLLDIFKKFTPNIVKTSGLRGLEETYVPHASFTGNDKQNFTSKNGTNIDTLYNAVKSSPEVMSCILAIVEDIMADSWKFIGSKNAINSATKFQIKSKLYQILTNAIIDLLITGNAYILKLSVNEEKVKSLVSKLTSKVSKQLNVNISKEAVYELVSQDFKIPKDLQLLKSSTMTINYDDTGSIASYEQKVKGNKRVYMPKDIIHLTTTSIGGQPYGFSPIETLLSDLATLIFAKEFAGKYFENDGIPYFVFHMPDDSPDSPNYINLKKQLQELKKQQNKYRSMVVTGNVQAEQVNKFNKDMEFAKLIQHFTQIVLMMLGVPAHRVNLTVDVKNPGSSINRAYEGYYKKIAFMQRGIENILNYELWDVFNVEMLFQKAYKIDEMREAQIAQILSQIGAVTIEEIRDRIGMDPQIPSGTMPNKTGDDNSINFNEDKRRENGTDNNKPMPDKTDNKNKVMKSLTDAVDVNLDSFVVIVEGMFGLGNFDKAKILFAETEDEIIMWFKDGNWTYKSRVDKNKMPKFKGEMLRNAIKIPL